MISDWAAHQAEFARARLPGPCGVWASQRHIPKNLCGVNTEVNRDARAKGTESGCSNCHLSRGNAEDEKARTLPSRGPPFEAGREDYAWTRLGAHYIELPASAI